MNTTAATIFRHVNIFGVIAWVVAISSLAAPASSAQSLPAAPPPLLRIEEPVDLATVSGSDVCQHIITEPGSYYLSGHLDVTKSTGVNIQAPGVTLDLNGFSVRRVSDSGGHGILIALPADGCTVKNGSITGFAYGVLAFSRGGTYCGLRATHCEIMGLGGGDNWLIERCRTDDTANIGIFAGNDSVLIH